MQELKKWHDWEVTKFLGQGSFGKVYQIERTAYGHIYKSALKVIKIPSDTQQYDNLISTGMTHEDAKEYFNEMAETISQEFALMSELRGNSNIVSFEDFEVIPEDDGYSVTIYIRMELLEPLIHYMKNNTMTRNDVIQLGCDVLKALELCEQRNIIHRDIKPENVFRSDQGTFKLGDFGIARELDRGDTGMSKKGTVSYMAPEVYRGISYGANVDIYSLGIMLYRLMNNNRLPFLPPYPEKIKYADTEQANLRRITGEELPFPCNAEDDFGDIILRACRFDPASRYQSASEMREDLEKLAAGTYQPVPDGDRMEDDEEATVGYPLDQPAPAPADTSVSLKDEESIPAEEPSVIVPVEKKPEIQIPPAEKVAVKTKDVKGPRKGRHAGLIAAAVLVLVFAAVFAINKAGYVEIKGEKVDRDRTSVYFSDDEINADELQKLNKLSKLEKIEFQDCTITNEEMEALGSLKTGVTQLIIDNCSGFDDISPLANMPFLGFLNLSSCGITDDMLSGMDFSKMENLTALRLQDNPGVSTIAPLETVIPQLKALSISNTSVTDISKLNDAGEMKVLLAVGCGIGDISSVNGTNMLHIDINGNNVSDISAVKNMPKLMSLYINNNNVSDLSPLAGLADLFQLRANGNNITDLSPLASCPALKKLQVCGNGIESLEALSGHSTLTDFYANNNKLTSLNGLENELELSYLSVSGNMLTDMTGAENFTQLETVNLEGNDIKDISVLKKSAEHLSWVDISGNPVGSLDALSGTTKLTGLYCDDTGIKSIDVVGNNPELESISAQNNQISSMDVLADKPALVAVDLSGNKISDMSPLSKTTYSTLGNVTVDLQDNDVDTLVIPDMEGFSGVELAIAGNPVKNVELSGTQRSDGIELEFLGMTYYDGMAGADWINYLGYGTIAYIENCPMDKQVALRDALGNRLVDDNISYTQKSDIEDYIAPLLYKVKKGNATVGINERYGKDADYSTVDDDGEIDELLQGEIL